MSPSPHWALRKALSPQARRRVRRLVDPSLSGLVGSWSATKAPAHFSLTFDDGPDAVVTPLLLDVLDEMRAPSTFFLLVAQCRQHPGLARQIRDRGHEVALHGVDHRRLTSMSARDARHYLAAARAELVELTGGPVAWYRPPYGAQSLSSYRATRSAGLSVVVWSADARDWVDQPADQLVSSAVEGLAPGSVLLFHERLEPDPLRGAPTTTFDRPAAVRRIIGRARERGLEPATFGELVGRHGGSRTVWFRP